MEEASEHLSRLPKHLLYYILCKLPLHELRCLDMTCAALANDMTVSVSKRAEFVPDRLNVGKFRHLTKLDCGHTAITALDVSKCPHLIELVCNSTQITSLDVSGCKRLLHLDCCDIRITSIDLFGCPDLRRLLCVHTDMTSLDVIELQTPEHASLRIQPDRIVGPVELHAAD